MSSRSLLLLSSLLFAAPVLAQPLEPDAVHLRLGGGFTSLDGSAAQFNAPGLQFRGSSPAMFFAEARGFLRSGIGAFVTTRYQSISIGEVGAWALLRSHAGVAARSLLGPLWIEGGVGYGFSLEPVPGMVDGPQRTARFHSVIASLRGRVELPAKLQLDVAAIVPMTLHLSGPDGVPLDGHATELEAGLSRRMGVVQEIAWGVRLAGMQRRFTARGAQGHSAAISESAVTLGLDLSWHPKEAVVEEEW